MKDFLGCKKKSIFLIEKPFSRLERGGFKEISLQDIQQLTTGASCRGMCHFSCSNSISAEGFNFHHLNNDQKSFYLFCKCFFRRSFPEEGSEKRMSHLITAVIVPWLHRTAPPRGHLFLPTWPNKSFRTVGDKILSGFNKNNGPAPDNNGYGLIATNCCPRRGFSCCDCNLFNETAPAWVEFRSSRGPSPKGVYFTSGGEFGFGVINLPKKVSCNDGLSRVNQAEHLS